MKKNTNEDLAILLKKICAGGLIAVILSTEALIPYHASAAVDIVLAKKSMSTALSQLNSASSTLKKINTQFEKAENGVLSLALTQGLSAKGMNVNQITDASALIPDDVTTLAETMVKEAKGKGALKIQLENAGDLDPTQAREIVVATLCDSFNVDAAFAKSCTLGVDRGDYVTPSKDEMTAYIKKGVDTITKYPGVLSPDAARKALAKEIFGYDENKGPTCTETPERDIVCVPPPLPPGFYTNTAITNFISMNIEKTVATELADKIKMAKGTLDEVTYKKIFASTIPALTGSGVSAELANALGAKSLASFQSGVTDAIHASILNQVDKITALTISPTTLNASIKNIVGDTKTQLGANVAKLADDAVAKALQSSGGSFKQLADLSRLDKSSVQSMLDGAIKDAKLTNITDAERKKITDNLTETFNKMTGSASVSEMQTMIAGEMGKTLKIDPSTIVTKLNDATLGSIQGTIGGLMKKDIVGQIGSLSGNLSTEKLNATVANAMRGTTGFGNVAEYAASLKSIPNFDTTISGVKDKITGVLSAQNEKFAAALSPENIQNLISTKLTGLTGVGDVNSILAKINPDIGKSLSAITKVGGQLEGINQQFAAAFDSTTIGLSSLTASFNGNISSLSALGQTNLLTMTDSISTLTSSLSGQISELTAPIANLSTVASDLIGGGSLSSSELESLTDSLSSITDDTASLVSDESAVSDLSGNDGVADESSMSQLPFGGTSIYAIPCTCTPGFPWIIYLQNYVGSPILMYQPGASVLFPSYHVYSGGAIMTGLYSETSMTCLVGVTPYCTTIGAGPIITMVGTGL